MAETDPAVQRISPPAGENHPLLRAATGAFAHGDLRAARRLLGQIRQPSADESSYSARLSWMLGTDPLRYWVATALLAVLSIVALATGVFP